MANEYICIAKRGYVPLTAEDQEVIPSNLGAIKKGLQALLKEDAEDDDRADQKWAAAKALLNEESSAETGPAAEGTVDVADDCMMASMGGRDTGTFAVLPWYGGYP